MELRQEVNVGHAPVNEEMLWPYLDQLDRQVEGGAIVWELEALRRTQAQAFEDLRHRDGWNIHLPGYAPEEREGRRREAQNERRRVERLKYQEALRLDRERQAQVEDERERERRDRERKEWLENARQGERLQSERREKARLERERIAREQVERTCAERQRKERQRIGRERIEKERMEKERSERLRIEIESLNSSSTDKTNCLHVSWKFINVGMLCQRCFEVGKLWMHECVVCHYHICGDCQSIFSTKNSYQTRQRGHTEIERPQRLVSTTDPDSGNVRSCSHTSWKFGQANKWCYGCFKYTLWTQECAACHYQVCSDCKHKLSKEKSCEMQ